MTHFRKLAAGVAVALALSAPAHAHRAWILPSTFTLSGDEQLITVDGAISNDLFFPNHVAMRLDDMKITAPDGTVTGVENGWTGKIRSTFDVTLDQQGTYKIGTGGNSFFASWEEDGERRRARGTYEGFKEEGVLDKEGVELTKMSRQTATFVTLGAPTDDVFATTGEGLEFTPVTHPNDVYTGEEITFGFTLDGAPIEGMEVEIVKGHDRYRDEQGTLELTTDADGQITFTLEESGRYWLETGTQGTTMVDGKEIGARSGYVVTFEALSF